MDLIAVSFVASIMINIFMFIPAYFWQTDKLTDISYSGTFIILIMVYQMMSEHSQPLLSVMILLWAVRLGWYLLWRIHLMGHDKRFDGMRSKASSFVKFWLLQGIAVPLIILPVTLCFSSPQGHHPAQYVGVGVWLLGLVLETTADYQKCAFRMDARHNNQWMANGLYAYCRFPNYLGEIMVWTGIWMVSAAHLSYFHALVALTSPLFIAFLLLKVSGVPLLEQSYQKRFGNNPKFQNYVTRTPLLIPRCRLFRITFFLLSGAYISLLLWI